MPYSSPSHDFPLQKQGVASHSDRKYAQLRNDQELIGDSMLFKDLSNSFKDAKAVGDVSRSVSKTVGAASNHFESDRFTTATTNSTATADLAATNASASTANKGEFKLSSGYIAQQSSIL